MRDRERMRKKKRKTERKGMDDKEGGRNRKEEGG